MYRNSILVAALITGAFASENPFVVEKNIQRIEQGENDLLQALAIEQKKREAEEDYLLEESISEPKVSDAKPEESKVSSEEKTVEEPKAEVSESQEAPPPQKELEEPAITGEVAEKPEATMVSKPEIAKAEPLVEKQSEELETEMKKPEVKAEVKEEPITIREVAVKAETETVSKSETTKVQPAVEKQVLIQKPEEKLESSKAESVMVDEVSVQSGAETNDSAEKNATFEKELQEAIRSVQD